MPPWAVYTTHGSGDFTLEDDVSPTITGPLSIGGALDIHGPNGAGTAGDLILDANIAATSLSFTSGAGIIQLGGDVQASGNLVLLAANGIIQAAGDATGLSVLSSSGGSLALTSGGLAATSAGAISTTGIEFAGNLSAAAGMTLVAQQGGITEASGGSLAAGTLTGSSAGTTSLEAPSGNAIGTLGAFTTTAGGDLLIQDEDSADLVISGPGRHRQCWQPVQHDRHCPDRRRGASRRRPDAHRRQRHHPGFRRVGLVDRRQCEPHRWRRRCHHVGRPHHQRHQLRRYARLGRRQPRA